MTDTAPDWTRDLVPDGTDFLDGLTIREMDIASRKLGVSVETAIKNDVDGKKWAALAHVAWLWDKRRNPTEAKLDRWMDLTGEQLADALIPDEPESDDDQEVADDDENPTESAPA